MRRIAAVLVALALAGLWGCGEKPVAPDPNRPRAIMEPLQGGPMLYAFPDDSGDQWGAYGIINQDGELVAKPKYYHRPRYVCYSQHDPQYVYDKGKERIIGLLAKHTVDEKGQGAYTYYTLDGKAKELNCGAAYDMTVAPGGHYAVVVETNEEYYDDSRSSWVILSRHGLFDIEANTWAVKPEEGQTIGSLDDMYRFSDAAIMRIRKSNKLEQWHFDYETGEQRILPADWDIINSYDYVPEVQWFRGRAEGGFRWYDRSFNPLPQLNNWNIYEFRGKYAPIMPSQGGSDAAWVDKDGNVTQENRYRFINNIWEESYCYTVLERSQIEKEIAHNNDPNLYKIIDERAYILLDANLKQVFKGEPGDTIAAFEGPIKGYVLLDANRQVKASCDAYGKPLPISDTPVVLHTVSYNSWIPALWFVLQGGVWRATPDLSRYGLNCYYYYDGCEGEFIDAKIVEAFEDHILISGYQGRAEKKQEKYIYPTLFAVDWDGNLYPNSPLEPFFGCAWASQICDFVFENTHGFQTAGPQGPSYYWVEHEGQRGYIDVHGNWLFIDES